MKLVVVSGLSGSGKSVALNVLEDAGFYCVDNLPAMLLVETVEFLHAAGHSRVAVSVDARSAALPALPTSIERLRDTGIDCRVLFLEANPIALLRRFSETRRSHPLTASGMTLSEAIDRERDLLGPVSMLGHRIDTSDMATKVLQAWVKDVLEIESGTMTLLFESFGFGRGIPLDADWVFDVRMLPNPHYEPGLRELTGRDAPVAEFLSRQAPVVRLQRDIETFLSDWLPEIARENRSYVTVAIGCTGGRHRSVYLAEQLAARFRADWRVLVRHRALSIAAAQAL